MKHLVDDLTNKISAIISSDEKHIFEKDVRNILTETLSKFSIIDKDDLAVQKQLLVKLIDKIAVLESQL